MSLGDEDNDDDDDDDDECLCNGLAVGCENDACSRDRTCDLSQGSPTI